jgi:bacillithiol system protein YtxJ
MLQWNPLSESTQVDEIYHSSFQKPVLIFKHSTRCSISAMALARLERQWSFSLDSVSPWFLDLLRYRNISNEIASRFNIEHQSPQVLLIKDGVCVFNTSHNDISVPQIGDALEINNA